MSKKMFQHFITLVLVGCMLLQSFPVHLRAETDKIEDASTEQTQLQQTENVEPADEEFVIEEEQGEVVPVDPQVTDDPEQEEPVVTEESEQEEPVVTEEPELEAEVDVPDQENPEGTPDPEVTPETTEESEEIVIVEDGVSYLLVGSNRNGNKTVLSGLLNRLKTDAGYEPVDFLGLTGVFAMESSSELMTEVQSAHQRLNATSVALVNRISYNEDFENLDDAGVLHTTSGLLYEDEHVYVYGVPALEIKDGTSAIGKVEEFKTWANDESTDPYKTIVILTEVPLHATVQNLDDANNRSAYLWHEAFNAVATTGSMPRDIVVLFGGATEDTYLPVGSKMTVQRFNDTVNSVINYTYVSSGNLGEDNSAVLVYVGDDYFGFRKYDTDLIYSESLGDIYRYHELGVNTFVEETLFGEIITVSAIASSMNVDDVLWDEYPFLNENLEYYYHMAFDITLEDYVEGNPITVSLPVPDYMKTSNFKVYHLVDDDFVEITDYSLLDDVLIFNASSAGVFAYGEAFVEVPVEAEMVSLQIRRLPYQREYLVGESLNTDGLIVEATYSDGTNAYVKELDWVGFDSPENGYGVTYDSYQIGKQDIIVSHTWGTVTLSTQFEITIGYKEFVDSVTGVQLEFEHGGVTSATIQNVHDDEQVASIAEFLFGEHPYEAYDITLTGHNKGEKVTVSFPVPEGADPEKLAAYHIDGPYLRKNPGHVEGNMYVFEADSFSSYLVGEETVEVDDPITKEIGSSSSLFQYVEQIESGNQYMIVNKMEAGQGYALKGNTTTATSVTITSQSSRSVINNLDSSLVWVAEQIGEKWYFKNLKTNSYLSYEGASTITFTNNRDKGFTLDISYNLPWYHHSKMRLNETENQILQVTGSTWGGNRDWSADNNTYFYEGSVTSGVYSIPEQSIYSTVEPGVEQRMNLTSQIIYTEYDKETDVTQTVNQTDFTYTIVKQTNGIISSINGQQLILSGTGGEALIKVEYTGNNEYKGITNYILVRTVEPSFKVEITDDQKNQITDVVVVKGVTNGQNDKLDVILIDQFDEVVENYNSENLTWSSSNENVATVDEKTGLVTFTGISGRVQITATYTYANGNRVTVDTITYSVSTSTSVLPSDGTNDFPEYPNEGAVRLDKTLTTIGNFSQTGIVTIELSLTGVPYTVGSEIDVVLMLDRSTSMTKDRIDATVAATKLFVESIVKKEDGSFNSNRIYVGYFMGNNTYDITDAQNIGGRLTSVDNENELRLLLANIEAEYTVQGGNTGTNYDVALRDSKAIVDAARKDGTGNDRDQFVVFMTDGAPSTFRYITNYTANGNPAGYNSATLGYNQVNERHVEYHSTLMKHDEVNIYTVGAGIGENTNPEAAILKNIASGAENAYFIDNADDTEGLKQAFSSIATEIKNAATDVKVVDKITDEFNLVLAVPNKTIEPNLPKDFEFCVELLEYTLDPVTKERVGDPVVKERITINDKDKIVMGEEGKVLSITGKYFSYDSDTHILSWNEEKLTNTEFALRYDLYLDNSVGIPAEEAVESGTYPTNEYATLNYINHLGNACENVFPIPQVTYNGAQVSYVFYLVNEYGQPVNRAGKVVPFQEAVYVTDIFTETMIWKSTERQDALEATYLAADLLPDVYTLFDPMAGYQIHCFAEDVLTNNHFKIEGDPDKPLTTYVFNTKADAQKYKELSVYSKTETFLCKNYDGVTYNQATNKFTYDKSVGLLEPYLVGGEPVFVTEIFEGEDPAYYVIAYKHGAKPVHQNFDFGNTTVAFAVLWEPKLAQDTVVIDYGLPVVVNVTQNDNLTSGLKGLLDSSPAGVEINEGTYQKDSGFLESVNLKFGTASIESQTSVRYTLSDMIMTEPEVFYYESDVTYYDSLDNLRVDNMYSSVTVIPATSIYYEDSFVDFKTYSTEGTEIDNKWTQEGTTIQNATQQTDRPGPDKIGKLYDADNVYGYDAAYDECSTYSLGSAMKFTADLNQYGTATFEFIGTGFDIFGVTSNTTGTILVDVYEKSGSLKETYIVDTYYGYTYDAENDEWELGAIGANTLYQIPVISVDQLEYDNYEVVISVIYSPNFDHTGAGSYDFYLDAIRIFDPAGNVEQQGKETIKDAYIKDDEYEPTYHELRNEVINASDFVKLGNTSASGIVFVDGKPAVDISTYAISDYKNFGPNNELYLAANQAITFGLNGTSGVDTSKYDVKVQIGLKSITGTAAAYRIAGAATADEVKDKLASANLNTLNSATEMYYDITDLNGKTVVIENTSGILSITNIKITLVPKATSTASAYSMQRAIAYITPFVVADAEDETPLFTVNPMMTREVVWAMNGGRQTPVVQMPSDVLGPEAPEDLVEVVEPVEDLIEVDPGDLPIVAEKREETVLEQLKPEDFFEKFNVFDPQQDNIFMRILSFIASFFAEFVLWLKQLLGF